MSDTAKVEGHTHLVRDLKSQAIINTDSDAYARYMSRKRKQKEQNDEIRSVIRDVNELKTVLTGTNSSYPPLIKDMRGIALAV